MPGGSRAGAEPRVHESAAGGAAATVAWALVGVAGVAAMARLEPNLVEEGLMLHVGQRLAAGDHLYRDVVFFSGPFGFELLGLLLRGLGESIWVARGTAALFHGAATAASFAVARRAGAGPLAHVAAAGVAASPALLFPLLSTFYYTPLAMCLGFLSVAAADRGARRNGWAFAAGLGVAAVALNKQTLGVAFAAALLPALAATAPRGRGLRAAGAMGLGGAVATLATLAFYGLRGDLPDLWRCLVSLPLSLGETYRAPFINLWPPGVLADEIIPYRPLYLSNLFLLRSGFLTLIPPRLILATQLLYALPFVALLLTVASRARGPLPAGLWLNGAFLLAMATNLFPRSDWGHLVPVLPPTFVQLVLVGAQLLGKPRRVPHLVPALAGVLALAVAGSAVSVGRHVWSFSAHPSWGPRVPLRPVSETYRSPAIPRVINYLRERTEPGDPIFIARAEPLLYFATDTTNPTPFTGVLTVLHEEQEQAILAALPDVKYVVMTDTDQDLWTWYSDELPGVWAQLERHYRLAPYLPLDDQAWILVLERGPDRGPTLVDLFEEPPARAWIRESRDGPRLPAPPVPRLVARQIRRPLPMALGRWGGGLDFHVLVPEGGRFQAGIGFRGMNSHDGIFRHPKHSHMVVSVGRDGVFEKVLDERVDDSKRGGRSWAAVEADLSKWGGERVNLRLELVPERRIRADDLTWWGSPRITGSAGGN